jgi:hypothetical protein
MSMAVVPFLPDVIKRNANDIFWVVIVIQIRSCHRAQRVLSPISLTVLVYQRRRGQSDVDVSRHFSFKVLQREIQIGKSSFSIWGISGVMRCARITIPTFLGKLGSGLKSI